MSKTISILGATGSVGMQALDVAKARGFHVDFISAAKNVKKTEEIAREFHPKYVAMADAEAANSLKSALADTDIKILSGSEGICEGVALSESETVVNSIIGEAGLLPTLSVIDAGKRLALANKESRVSAGEIGMERARARGVSDFAELKGEMRDALAKYIYQQTKRKPMILPIIMDL